MIKLLSKIRGFIVGLLPAFFVSWGLGVHKFQEWPVWLYIAAFVFGVLGFYYSEDIRD